VCHPGRQDGYGLARCPAVAAVQVVADRAAIDDEDRPGFVAVRRIGVIDQVGVEHLADSRHPRCPRLDMAPAGQFRVHVKIVQDRNLGPEDAECMTAAPISLSQALAAFDDVYSPRIVGRVNDYDVKVAHTAGEHVWHVHERTDEFFLVIDGRFAITLRGPGGQERTVELSAGDIFVVPKGTEHKPSSPGGAILMFEPRGTLTTGDRHEGDIPAYVDTTTGRDIGE
jgi:mannose-6-phosphate isomerase-like protein (cupin superfamily)